MSNLLNNIFGSAGIGNATQGLLGGASHQTLSEEEYVRQHLSQQYTQNLAQSMMATGKQASQNVYNQMAGAQKPFDPNELPAYTSSLSNLVTLWQAKFGDEWVQKFDDEFWYDAAERLKAAGKLEVVKHVWYRIKEDA